MDRCDGPHRSPCRHRFGHAAHSGRRCRRWHLPHHRHQDLHHQRRARLGGEHRSPGTRPRCRRTDGHPGHQPVHRAEVHSEPGRLPRPAQCSGKRLHRAQDGGAGQFHQCDELRWRGRLSGGRGERGPSVHVHHDELRASVGRPARAWRGRTGLSASCRLRQGPPAGPGAHRSAKSRRRGGLPAGASGRAPHAAHHARLHRSGPGVRHAGWTQPRRRQAQGRRRKPSARGVADADCQGLSERQGLGERGHGPTGSRWPWLHQGVGHGADRARCSDRADL